MKLELLKKHLEEVVQIVSRVSNKNLSLPVLSCVLLVAEAGRTVLRATNLDVSVEVVLKSKIIEDGVVAVPAQVFSQTVSAIADEKVVLEEESGVLHVKSSHGEAKLKTLDASEFPTLPYVKEGEGVSVTLSSKEFLHTIKSTSFAASTSGMRPELASVFLHISDGNIIAAATDSFRLAEIKLKTKNKQNTNPILIPIRNIQDITRLVSNSETVEIRVGENQATYIAAGSFITSRIIDGAFPQYEAIIPKDFTTTATVLKEDILQSLKKTSVFTDQSNQVEFSLDMKNKTFTTQATNSQVGEAVNTTDAAIEGGDVTMHFNVRYILDALNATTADSVVFKFSGPGKPLIINEVPDSGFTYLVMPMNK